MLSGAPLPDPSPAAESAALAGALVPPTPERSTGVHVALVIVQLAFASLAVEGKLAMSPRFGVSSLALAMVRILGGAAVFLVAHLVLRTPRVRSLRDALELGALALFGIVINQALFLAGLQRTSPVAATLLTATIPVFTALVAALAGRGRITLRAGAGIAIAVFGIAVLSGFKAPGAGDALVIVNAASYAIYVVFAKKMLARYGTVTVVAWIFGWGAILFAPVGVVTLVREAPGWPAAAGGILAFVVLVPTVIAYSVNAWALRRAAPTLVTIYVYLQPLLVAALAWIQLGQAPPPSAAFAAPFILAGVTLVAFNR